MNKEQVIQDMILIVKYGENTLKDLTKYLRNDQHFINKMYKDTVKELNE